MLNPPPLPRTDAPAPALSCDLWVFLAPRSCLHSSQCQPLALSIRGKLPLPLCTGVQHGHHETVKTGVTCQALWGLLLACSLPFQCLYLPGLLLRGLQHRLLDRFDVRSSPSGTYSLGTRIGDLVMKRKQAAWASARLSASCRMSSGKGMNRDGKATESTFPPRFRRCFLFFPSRHRASWL